MNTQEIWMLLQAHEKILGLPALSNIRAEIEKRLGKINMELAPKPVPQPPSSSAPVGTIVPHYPESSDVNP